MHVQVITGDGREGETNRLRHLKELKDWLNESGKIVHAEATTRPALSRSLRFVR